MDVWDLLVSAGSVGFILCLVPQLAKTVRSRRADDLSWGFLALVILSSALALPYAVHAHQWLLAASWGVNLLVWGLVLYYKARPGAMAKVDAPAAMAAAMDGKKLPATTFLDPDGKPLKSSALKLPAVLYFYPKDDTPGCTKQACGIRDHWAAFRKAGLNVYGVSKDDARSHQKFIAKYDLPFPLLTADEGTLAKLGAWQEKSMYGRTYMGIQRMTYLIGADGRVLKTYPKVKPEEHAEAVLADFKALA